MYDYIAGYMAGSIYFKPYDTYQNIPDISSYCLETNWTRPRRVEIPKTYGLWVKSPEYGFNLYVFDDMLFIDGLKQVCKDNNNEIKYIVTDTVFDEYGNIVLIQDENNSNLLEYRTGTYMKVYNDETDEIINEMWDENILEPYRNTDL